MDSSEFKEDDDDYVVPVKRVTDPLFQHNRNQDKYESSVNISNNNYMSKI